MGRRKKEFAPEKPVEMKDDALNLPAAEDPVQDSSSVDLVEEINEFIEPEADIITSIQPAIEPKSAEISPKKIKCSASRINVRANPDGEILYTIPNLSKVLVEEEKDGWCKIVGYVMKDLVADL